MPLEERFVAAHVFDSDDVRRAHRHNLVYELHWIAVRKEFANTYVVHQRFVVRVVDWGLHFVFADFLAHQSSKLVVNCVSGACCHNTAFYRFTDEGHISYNI